MKSVAPRHIIPAVIVMVLALVAIVWLIPTLSIILQSTGTPTSTPTPTPTVGQLTVEGEVVCLPHQNQNGPQTMECAYGLKSDSGSYYGLQNLDQQQLINATITTGQRYRVTGISSAPASDNRYAIVSTISVKSIEKM